MDVDHAEVVAPRAGRARLALAVPEAPVLLRLEARLAGPVPEDVKRLVLRDLHELPGDPGSRLLRGRDVARLVQGHLPGLQGHAEVV